MDEASNRVASFASLLASGVQKRQLVTCGLVIHVGDPRIEEPHRSMMRAEQFHERYPDKRLIIVLWEDKEFEELKGYGDPSWCQVHKWGDAGTAIDYLMDHVVDTPGAMVIQPTWYICKDGHITRTKNEYLIEKCETCGEPCEIRQPLMDKHKEFADIFLRVVGLVNFDTRSGEFLQSQVDPMYNILMNMPYALGLPPGTALDIEHIMGSGKGKPILLIAAGPSLDEQLDDIKRLQDRCLISCVGRSLKLLQKHGIRVDYTVSVEMFDWDSAIFGGLTKETVGDTILVYCSVTAPKLVAEWPGKKVCVWDPQTAKMLKKETFILGGNSVAHHQLSFAAQILQSEPIILVGNDLAYTKPGDVTHAEGTDHDWKNPEINKKDSAPHSELQWVPCTGKGVLYPECHQMIMPHGCIGITEDIQVKSSAPYQHFSTLFTILLRKYGKKAFNACPNGQKIIGTEYLDLKTFNP